MKVYQEVETQFKAILASVYGIKTIEEYNEQYENTETENAVLYPAVYSEILEPIEWEHLGNNHQAADVRIALHVACFYLKNEKATVHQVAQNVFSVVQGSKLTDSDGNQLTTELIRVSSSMPKRYGNLKVIQVVFNCRLFDCSVMPVPQNAQYIFSVQT